VAARALRMRPVTMIRITELFTAGGPPRLRIEGRLTDQTAGELRQSAETILSKGETLLVDVSGVLFADAAGIALLREIERRGAVFIGSSGFLREMMDAEAASSSFFVPRQDDGEAQLLAGLRRGDGQAFEQCVKQYGGRMLAVARRMLGNNDDASDAVQEAMISAFRAIGGFSGSARLSTWLHRIVVNAVLMKLRRRRRKPEESIDALLPRFDADGSWATEVAGWATPSDVLLQRAEDRGRVRACIDRLPEAYRTVLLLRDIEELDTFEVANLLAVTPNAVKIRLHRARQALRALLEVEFGGDADRASRAGRAAAPATSA
jgi:RNA polymerase sigma-70 factor, ECF subfamily